MERKRKHLLGGKNCVSVLVTGTLLSALSLRTLGSLCSNVGRGPGILVASSSRHTTLRSGARTPLSPGSIVFGQIPKSSCGWKNGPAGLQVEPGHHLLLSTFTGRVQQEVRGQSENLCWACCPNMSVHQNRLSETPPGVLGCSRNIYFLFLFPPSMWLFWQTSLGNLDFCTDGNFGLVLPPALYQLLFYCWAKTS